MAEDGPAPPLVNTREEDDDHDTPPPVDDTFVDEAAGVSKSSTNTSRSTRSKLHVNKRPSDSTEVVVSKNQKRKIDVAAQAHKGKFEQAGNCVTEEKKPIRLMSEEDEIVVLNGFFDYKSEKGSDPSSNMDAFHEYVNPRLSVGITKTQLYEKVRRLKNKFLKNAQKSNKNHEQELYELSNKLWGDDAVVIQRNHSKEEKKADEEDFWSLYPALCACIASEASAHLYLVPMVLEKYLKKTICAIGEDKAKELEEDWKAFDVMEWELYAHKANLILKQT